MLITTIQIKTVDPITTKMRGVATITLDDMIAVHDIKILKSDDKWFLAMPSKKTKAGSFKDIVHPINADVRGALELLLIGGYERAEQKGLSRLKMVYANTGKEDLTKQTFEDFTVLEGETTNVTNPVNQNLLKWLED